MTIQPVPQIQDELRSEMSAMAVAYLMEYFKIIGHGGIDLPESVHIRHARTFAVNSLNYAYQGRFRAPSRGQVVKVPYRHSLREIVEGAAHQLGYKRVEHPNSRKNYQWQLAVRN